MKRHVKRLETFRDHIYMCVFCTDYSLTESKMLDTITITYKYGLEIRYILKKQLSLYFFNKIKT